MPKSDLISKDFGPDFELDFAQDLDGRFYG